MPVFGGFVACNPFSTYIPAEKALTSHCPQKRLCLVAPGADNYFCYVVPDMFSAARIHLTAVAHEVVLLSLLERCFGGCVCTAF